MEGKRAGDAARRVYKHQNGDTLGGASEGKQARAAGCLGCS